MQQSVNHKGNILYLYFFKVAMPIFMTTFKNLNDSLLFYFLTILPIRENRNRWIIVHVTYTGAPAIYCAWAIRTPLQPVLLILQTRIPTTIISLFRVSYNLHLPSTYVQSHRTHVLMFDRRCYYYYICTNNSIVILIHTHISTDINLKKTKIRHTLILYPK